MYGVFFYCCFCIIQGCGWKEEQGLCFSSVGKKSAVVWIFYFYFFSHITQVGRYLNGPRFVSFAQNWEPNIFPM